MRIAIDANVLEGNWGGIPKYADRIAAGLAATGDEVFLLRNSRHPTHVVAGTRPVNVRVKGTVFWRNGFLPLWLKGFGIEVLWAPEGVLPWHPLVPTVVTVHDLAMLRFPGTKPDVHVRQYRRAVARSARRATRVIAVSQATSDDLRELWGLGGGTVRIVPNGVDDWLTPGDRTVAIGAVRERWAITTPFVLHVGSIEPRKGLDVLIDAAALASERGAPWRLVLAGAAGFRGDEITARARASGACSLLGAVSEAELLSLYRAADAFAAPAISEGFGIAPLEAMACGTPVVIAGDSGGLEETSGAAAIVVRERTPSAWLDSLEEAIKRPQGLIDTGLRHAARFRWSEVTERTRAVLTEATGA